MAAAAHMWLEAVRPACDTTCCHQQEHGAISKVLEIGWYMEDLRPVSLAGVSQGLQFEWDTQE